MHLLLLLAVLVASTVGGPPPGFSLIWNEEFGESGFVDTENGYWLPGKRFLSIDGVQAGNTRNNYATRDDLIKVEGGYLHLTAKKETNTYRHPSRMPNGRTEPYVAGAVQTFCGPKLGDWCRPRGDQYTYDEAGRAFEPDSPLYVEVSAKIPPGRGLWPAVWLMPSQGPAWPVGGEIDIMETVRSDDRVVHHAMHYASRNDDGSMAHTSCGGRYRIPADQPDISEAFHTYAALWDPKNASCGVVRFFTDGVEGHTNCAGLPRGAKDCPAPFDKPFYILLNLGVGGDWPGMPPPDVHFPATMLVDYVRVYQKGAAPPQEAPAPRVQPPPSRDQGRRRRRRRRSP